MKKHRAIPAENRRFIAPSCIWAEPNMQVAKKNKTREQFLVSIRTMFDVSPGRNKLARSRKEEAMLDLILAVAHHILIFGLFGVLFAEFLLVRPGLDAASIRRIAAIDLWYGITAGLII